MRGFFRQGCHAPHHFSGTKRDLNTTADIHLLGEPRGDQVIEFLAQGHFERDTGNHRGNFKVQSPKSKVQSPSSKALGRPGSFKVQPPSPTWGNNKPTGLRLKP